MNNLDLLQRIYPGRRAELKRAILAEALQCFTELGIEASTIEMICERAGASVGAVYHHFKHKDGIAAALYKAALSDQAMQRMAALEKVQGARHGVEAIIRSYIEWVQAYPDFARFLYAARRSVQQCEQQDELAKANQQRNQQLMLWLMQQPDRDIMLQAPPELLPSLIIGATESYCRAWLSGRVKAVPEAHAAQLAQAAWQSLQGLA